MSVHIEALRRYIGKPAKDIYGRYVGYVIGLILDPMGQLNSVGVDHGNGGFMEYPNKQVMIDNENLVLIPTWKAECDNYREESNLIQKRFKALDDLSKNGEIPQYVYEELHRQYKEALGRLQETYTDLTARLKQRIEELDIQTQSLERFIGTVKVQHKTGEMSEETYKAASEYIIFGINAAANEKRDIVSILDKLASPTETHTEAPPTQPAAVVTKPSEDAQQHQPFILHLHTSDD